MALMKPSVSTPVASNEGTSRNKTLCSSTSVKTPKQRNIEACVTTCGPENVHSKGLTVLSFYKFARIPDYACKQQPLVDICCKLRVSGVILLAPEGINGSLAGNKDAVLQVLDSIQSDERLANLRITPEDENVSAEDVPFRWGHVRVRLKKEVVSLGVPGLDPAKKAGKYVKPSEWNDLISDPDTVVIDVRNTYETRIGSFKGAVHPKTDTFREFPEWVRSNLNGSHSSPRRIATFCTGGIRCEKATAFLLNQGFDEVYHLEGGILKYLEEIQPADSLWEGECFVFDKRVSVEHGLKAGSYHLCYACKQPVSEEDMNSAEWELGVSCPYCFHEKNQEEKERARARQKQFESSGIIGG